MSREQTLNDIERAKLRRAFNEILAEGPENLCYRRLVEACEDHYHLDTPLDGEAYWANFEADRKAGIR